MDIGQVSEDLQVDMMLFLLVCSMLSKENVAGRVSLCIEELERASSVSSGPVLQIMQDTLAVFKAFCQEYAELDKASVTYAGKSKIS